MYKVSLIVCFGASFSLIESFNAMPVIMHHVHRPNVSQHTLEIDLLTNSFAYLNKSKIDHNECFGSAFYNRTGHIFFHHMEVARAETTNKFPYAESTDIELCSTIKSWRLLLFQKYWGTPLPYLIFAFVLQLFKLFSRWSWVLLTTES